MRSLGDARVAVLNSPKARFATSLFGLYSAA
jgi:hypothetical protein